MRRKRSFSAGSSYDLRSLHGLGSLEHMLTVGWLAAAVGIILFHVALTMTLRANPTTRLPFYRSAEIVPPGSVRLRAIGAGLIVLGAALISTSAWYWPFVVVLAGPIAALTVITFHNRRIAERATG